MTEDWITLEDWCERSGDSKVGVRKRVENDVWQCGIHVASTEHSKDLRVHLPTALAWRAARDKVAG